jgi:acetyltransferase-like isoleucine patch superfamily enzyme
MINLIRKIRDFVQFLITYIFLRLKKVSFGKNPLFIHGFPIIKSYGKIIIGDNFRISCTQFKSELFAGKSGILHIGNNVFINRGVSIAAVNSIHIGNNCLIGDMVSIQDSDWHEVNQNQGVKISKIYIGNNVWIGRNCIILPGVSIGDHSVIAAGTIVSKDIPAKSLIYQKKSSIITPLVCSNDFKRK